LAVTVGVIRERAAAGPTRLLLVDDRDGLAALRAAREIVSPIRSRFDAMKP